MEMHMSFQKGPIPKKCMLKSLSDPYIIGTALVEDKDSTSSPRKLYE